MSAAFTAPTLLWRERGEVAPFAGPEDLARRVHDLRAGRRIDLIEVAATIDGAPLFPAVEIVARRRDEAPAFLAMAAGPGVDAAPALFAALAATRRSAIR